MFSIAVAPVTASLWCRRLSPEQSRASAQALQGTRPDDDFVIAMIRHWWHPAASARDADQGTTQGLSQAPLGTARAGQAQGQQPFEALTVGESQAAADGQVAEQLLAGRAEAQDSQEGSKQHLQSVTAHMHHNQAECTLQRMPPGSSQEQSFRVDVQPHVKQGSAGDQRHDSDHPVQLTGAEAAEATPPQPRAEPTIRTVNAGGS